MRAGHPLALALLSSLLVGGAAAAATPLTPANSIPFEFYASSSETFRGTDCGTTARATKRLPAGAMGIRVVTPRIGDRDRQGGGTKVTAVTVRGTAVTITVLADGPFICDPARTGVPAGEPVNWTATYDLRAEYKRRVQATIRVFYESYIFGARWQMRPPTIHDHRRGGARGERVTGITWKRFGGKTALGSGTLRQDFCRPGDNCPQNGKRMRLVASKPDYCKDSGRIEYLNLSGYIGSREWVSLSIECSP